MLDLDAIMARVRQGRFTPGDMGALFGEVERLRAAAADARSSLGMVGGVLEDMGSGAGLGSDAARREIGRLVGDAIAFLGKYSAR